MKLQDLVHRYRKPCIADLKIGAITYDPDASAEKIKSDRGKYPHLDEVGFQILGMRVNTKKTLLIPLSITVLTSRLVVPVIPKSDKNYFGNIFVTHVIFQKYLKEKCLKSTHDCLSK